MIVMRNPAVDNERARLSQSPFNNESTKPDSTRRPRAKRSMHHPTKSPGHVAHLWFQKAKRDNVRVDAAARIQSSIAGPIILRNTLPPLASNDLLAGRLQEPLWNWSGLSYFDVS